MKFFLSALTALLISGFLAALAALFLWHVPDGNRETLVYMVGQLSGFTSASLAYWYNTTHSSDKKTDLLAKAEPVKE